MRALRDILLTIAVVAIYLLPAIIADRKKRRSVLVLALFNVLLGWTIVGWFAALYWAFHPDSARTLERIVKNDRRASSQRTINAIMSRSRTRGVRGTEADPKHRDERDRD
ncbi:immunity protein [Caballeronia calidae]|uniref:Immunity protein n=1 Tax=Caballeronia calidae TaxID=1777139 RepID=A0A158CUY2_9BURK|nr:superinfection immunity protein [Caballeronia calidae]SAK86155.1 immunity protein [Caballeronia calidae]